MPKKELSPADQVRFARQTRLKEVGLLGQTAFRNARVLCIGAGGLSSPVLLYLAASGVGHLGIIDPDTVELSNLHRQVLFDENDLGFFKANAAEQKLKKINRELSVSTIIDSFCADNALEIAGGYDLIIEGSDDFATKLLVNQVAYRLKIPFIYGSVNQWEGEVAIFDPRDQATSCFRCFRKDLPKAGVQNCAQAGVLGPTVGMIGTHQALLALQSLLPALPVMPGILHRFDALSLKWFQMRIPKRKDCPCCSVKSEAVSLNEYLTSDRPALRTISAQKLSEWMADPAKAFQLIDVRTRDEWNQQHLPGAIHFELSNFESGQFPNLSSLSVLYCQGGVRSAKALSLWIKHRPEQESSLQHLQGGLDQFMAHSLRSRNQKDPSSGA